MSMNYEWNAKLATWVDASNHQSTLQHFLTIQVTSKSSLPYCTKLQGPGHLRWCSMAFTQLHVAGRPASSVSLRWDLLLLHLQHHKLRNSPRHPQTSGVANTGFVPAPRYKTCWVFPDVWAHPSAWHTASHLPSKLFLFCRTPRLPNPLCS